MTKPVLMDHDGGVDDLLSLMLLLTMPHVALRGVAITPADCYFEWAAEATAKIFDIFGRHDILIARGDLHGVNAFPAEWRAQPRIINALPEMLVRRIDALPLASVPAREFLAQQLAAASEPVTVLMTGPASNLAAALAAHPELRQNIAEVVWMAGALDVAGNVRTFAHDGSAEWNVFWDPVSARKLLEMRLPVTIFPLDATNHVPVTLKFLQRLAQQRRHLLSNLAGQFWATTINTIPHVDFMYHMWDTLATGYLGCPQAITFRKMEVTVVDSGFNAGQMILAPGSGQWVQVADTVNVPMFHDYILQQFNQDC